MEYDVWARIVADYSLPSGCLDVSLDVIERFRDRLPRKLLDFWRDHGWGSWDDGYLWMCDPSPFDSILETLFDGDKEFDAKEMTVVAYTAVNELKIWDRNGRTVLVDLRVSDCFAPPLSALNDPDTGKPFSHDFLAALTIKNALKSPLPLYKRASHRWGAVKRGEVFAYVPALQLGGDKSVENLSKVSVLEHMTFLSQLEPLRLTQLTPPSPDKPLGRLEVVRTIGPF